MTVGPVLVTVLPARTLKLAAVPRFTGATAAIAADCIDTMTTAVMISTGSAARPE